MGAWSHTSFCNHWIICTANPWIQYTLSLRVSSSFTVFMYINWISFNKPKLKHFEAYMKRHKFCDFNCNDWHIWHNHEDDYGKYDLTIYRESQGISECMSPTGGQIRVRGKLGWESDELCDVPKLQMSQIARFMGPTWGPLGSSQPQVGPILAPRTLLSGVWRLNEHMDRWRNGLGHPMFPSSCGRGSKLDINGD